MKHLLNTARGKHAKTQEDLLTIAMGSDKFTTEKMQSPLSEMGFCQQEDGSLIRMTPEVCEAAIYNLLRSRPSAILWDIKPKLPVDEVKVFDRSPEFYGASIQQRAEEIAELFLRNPKMVGFKLQMHDVSTSPTEPVNPNASVSLSIYNVDDDQDPRCPVDIDVTYRPRF
jgi:hypothetical protein